jgi:hypothetical protein
MCGMELSKFRSIGIHSTISMIEKASAIHRAVAAFLMNSSRNA